MVNMPKQKFMAPSFLQNPLIYLAILLFFAFIMDVLLITPDDLIPVIGAIDEMLLLIFAVLSLFAAIFSPLLAMKRGKKRK